MLKPPEESSFEPPAEPPVFGATEELPRPAVPPEESPTLSKEPPAEPPTPKAPEAAPRVEKPKTPAEALGDYFKKVESGTDFLQRIVSMPEDDELRGSMQLSELERLSGELSQKVIDFFALIETWEKDKKSAKEMGQSSEEFISSHSIPSGCQTAFRTVALFAINKILGPVADALKSSPKTEPAAPPAPGAASAAGGVPPHKYVSPAELVKGGFGREQTGGTTRGPLSVDEVLDNLAKGAPAPTPTGKARASGAPTAEKPKSRIWNYIPKDSAKTPPRTEATTYPPISSTETAPPAPSAEKVAEATPIPERIASSWTREKIEGLTFENLAELNDDELQAVVEATTLVSAGTWGKMMQDMPDSLVRRVRRAVNNQDYFDETLKGPVETAERLKDLRETHIRYAKDALLKASQLESPVRAETLEVTPTTPLEAPEHLPPAPPSIETAGEQKELTFDDLSKLGRMSLLHLFYAANVSDKPALLAVLSAHSELRRVMLAALHDVRRKEIEQDITALGSKTEFEIREAEKVIVEMARKQQQGGEISLPPTTESVAASGLTPEKIQSLTWEDLFKLDDDSLRAVVKASDSSSYYWGSLMRNMPEPLISRVRACVGNRERFDMGLSESKNPAEDERKYRENTVWYAKNELLKILQHENPS